MWQNVKSPTSLFDVMSLLLTVTFENNLVIVFKFQYKLNCYNHLSDPIESKQIDLLINKLKHKNVVCQVENREVLKIFIYFL